MQNFGKVLKKYRKSRGLSLKDVAGSGLSTSQLSRFEKGETDLTVTKLMIALEAINMPIHEFMYAAHDFHRDELNEILEQIRICVVNKDVLAMKQLLIRQTEAKINCKIFHQLNLILIKIRLQDLSGEIYYQEKELHILTDYLFGVDYWVEYELLLFSNTLDVLNYQTFMSLSREMIHRSDFYKELPNNRRLISTMMLNGYITCIECSEFMDALYFEKQLKTCFFTEVEVYERLIFRYARYLYQYKKSHDKKAIIEMKRCIGALKLVSSNHLAETYENHLKKILETE